MIDIKEMIDNYLARSPDECDARECRVLDRIAADRRADAAINAIAKDVE